MQMISVDNKKLDRTFFLFNDLLIVTKTIEGNNTLLSSMSSLLSKKHDSKPGYILRFEKSIRLHGLHVKTTPDSNTFELVNKADHPSIILVCPNKEEKEGWIVDINKGIAELYAILKFHEEQAIKRAKERLANTDNIRKYRPISPLKKKDETALKRSSNDGISTNKRNSTTSAIMPSFFSSAFKGKSPIYSSINIEPDS